jgi:hypothetical protein
MVLPHSFDSYGSENYSIRRLNCAPPRDCARNNTTLAAALARHPSSLSFRASDVSRLPAAKPRRGISLRFIVVPACAQCPPRDSQPSRRVPHRFAPFAMRARRNIIRATPGGPLLAAVRNSNRERGALFPFTGPNSLTPARQKKRPAPVRGRHNVAHHDGPRPPLRSRLAVGKIRREAPFARGV